MPTAAPVKQARDIIHLFDVDSILEVGCGKGGIIAQFKAPIRIGVDNFFPFLVEARQLYPGIIFMQHDILGLLNLFLPQSFDAVIGFDILEHIPMPEMGAEVQICEDLARKLVIFFSPLDELGLAMQPEPVEGNAGMKHITIIREAYFKRKGYATYVYPKYYKNSVPALLAIKEM